MTRPRYILASTNRSGSTWLADLLDKSGLGQPYSYYYPVAFDERLAYWRTKLPEYADFPTTPAEFEQFVWKSQEGIAVGLRVRGEDLVRMQREGFDFSSIDVWYNLTRRDKLRQAISVYRARMTGSWTSLEPERCEPVYDRWEITNWRAVICEEERFIADFLATRPCRKVVHLVYEEIDDGTVDKIAADLGVNLLDRPTSQYSIQRDGTTEQWVSRYREEEMRDLFGEDAKT